MESLDSKILYLAYQVIDEKIQELEKNINSGHNVKEFIEKLIEFNSNLYDIYENRLDMEEEFNNTPPKFNVGDVVKHSYFKYEVIEVHKNYLTCDYYYDLKIINSKNKSIYSRGMLYKISEEDIKKIN